jgi:ATP-dependent Clp protease ATP-binding subunit ClpC
MVTMASLPQTPRAKKVIEYAIEEARNLNHNYVGTEHLLLGPACASTTAWPRRCSMNLGLKLEEVREEVLNLLGAGNDNAEGQSGGPRGPRAGGGEQAR